MTVTNEELTTGKVNGEGTFDLLMEAMNEHVEAQFRKGHLTGPQFSEVYLGGLTTAMGQSIEFLLRRETTNKQNELLDEQITQAKIQTAQLELQNLQIAEQTKQVTEQTLLIKKQIEQLESQIALSDAQKQQVDLENALYPLRTMQLEKQNTQLDNQNALTLKEEQRVTAQIVQMGKQDQLTDKQILQMVAQTIQTEKQSLQIDKQTAQTEQQTLQLVEQTAQATAQTAQINKQTDMIARQLLQMDLQDQNLQAQINATTAQANVTTKQLDQMQAAIDLQQQELLKGLEEIQLLVQQQDINSLTMSKAGAEIDLLGQKLTTEQAQTMDSVSGLTITGIIGRQKSLYEAQTKGFKHDNDQKVAKIFSDIYSVARGTDNGVPLPFTAQSGTNVVNLNTELEEVLNTLKQSLNT